MPSATGIYGGAKLEAAMFEHAREYVLTIREVAEREFDDGKRKLELEFAETEKTFILNLTNCREIAAQLGDDYAGWPGRKIKLYRTRVDFQGKMVDAIRVGQPVVRSDYTPQRPAPTPQEQRGMADFEAARQQAAADAEAFPVEDDSLPF